MGIFGKAPTTNTVTNNAVSTCTKNAKTEQVQVSTTRLEAVSKGGVEIMPVVREPNACITQATGDYKPPTISAGNITQKAVQTIVSKLNLVNNQDCTNTATQSSEQEATSTAKGFAFASAEANNSASHRTTQSSSSAVDTVQRLRNVLNLMAVVDRKITITYDPCYPVPMSIGNIDQNAEQAVTSTLDAHNTQKAAMTTTQSGDQTATAETLGTDAVIAEMITEIVGDVMGFLGNLAGMWVLFIILLLLSPFLLPPLLRQFVGGGGNDAYGKRCVKCITYMLFCVGALIIVGVFLFPGETAYVPLLRPDGSRDNYALVGCCLFWLLVIMIVTTNLCLSVCLKARQQATRVDPTDNTV